MTVRRALLVPGPVMFSKINLASIRRAAATAAYSLQSMYNGNSTGGVLGKFPYPPFYWWLSGASWDGMLHYWLYTGDESYYNVTWEALVAQISETNNYLPVAEKFDEVCVQPEPSMECHAIFCFDARVSTPRVWHIKS